MGGEQRSKGLPGEAMASEVKAKAEEPPTALREVDKLTRNLEKLANAGGIRAGRTPESEKSHQDPPVSLPYQETERTGHHLAKRPRSPYEMVMDGQC